jgi:hypothetical protein
MSETKYGKHLINNPFYTAPKEFGGATMFKQTGEDGSGVMFEHHYVTDPKWSVSLTRTPETHELFVFVGGNPENIRDLGAEIHLTLGADDEEQIVTDSTVVIVPPGLKHGPITVSKFKKPFTMLRIVNSKEYQAKLDAEAPKESAFRMGRLLDGNEVRKHGKKYWMNMMRGPLYIDYEPGWTGTSIWAHHDEFFAGISLGYHCIVTPYDVRFSHSHNNHENLCFLSGDPNNPKKLGAQGKVALGEEKEELTFDTPTIISMPPGLKHCPLQITNVTKPVIFLEVSVTKAFSGKPEGF